MSKQGTLFSFFSSPAPKKDDPLEAKRKQKRDQQLNVQKLESGKKTRKHAKTGCKIESKAVRKFVTENGDWIEAADGAKKNVPVFILENHLGSRY